MIPYPSSSPVPLNSTAGGTGSVDVPGTAIAGVAIGALGIGTVFAVFQYMRVKPSAAKNHTDEESRTEEPEPPEIKIVPQELSYICINTVDLEEITQILTQSGKRFQVIQGPP